MPSSTLQLVKEPKAYQHINQVISALAVSFGPFAVGLGKGYTSPALASLLPNPSEDKSDEIPPFSPHLPNITITEQEGSWIASLSLLGALFGGLCSGLIIKHGRRKTLIYVSIPFSISWAFTLFAYCVEMIYATAFIAGFCSAIIQLTSQLYISEIAHPSIRGSLCSATKVASQIGLLSAFAMGAKFDWRQLALVCAGAPVMLLITAQYIPETPSFLLYTNQEERAERALQWLRGPDADISGEMATIHSNIRRMKDQGTGCKNVIVPQLVKPLLITCGLMFFLRFSGVAAFNFYAVTIFQASFGGGLLNPHLAAVITGTVQLLASALSGLLSDLIGRLPLLLLTSLLMSAALGGFGFYSFYRESITVWLSSETHSDWIPLLCVLTFVAAFSLGPNPISWLLVGEMYSLEYRGLGSSLTTAFSYVCAFVGVKTFVDLQESLGLHGTFWTYAIISTFGFLFSLAFVPETKGTNLDEMMPNLGVGILTASDMASNTASMATSRPSTASSTTSRNSTTSMTSNSSSTEESSCNSSSSRYV